MQKNTSTEQTNNVDSQTETGFIIATDVDKDDFKLLEINNEFLTYLNSWKDKQQEQSNQQQQQQTSSQLSPRKKQKTSSSSSSKVISNISQKNFPFRIRGESNGEALLCTDNSTFVIKRLETSNSIFPINSTPSQFISNVKTTNQDLNNSQTQETNILSLYGPLTYTLELTSTKPKLEKLFELLSSTAYAGVEEEEKLSKKINIETNHTNQPKLEPFGPILDAESLQSQNHQQQTNGKETTTTTTTTKPKLYTLEQLSYLVPSSDKELKDALSELGAFEFKGKKNDKKRNTEKK
jgi:hypothetical protein